MTDYPYASGPLIETPNTYFYSAFNGARFLRAWSDQRQSVLEAIGPAASDAPSGAIIDGGPPHWPVETLGLLDHVYACLAKEDALTSDTQVWLERLIRKFEVTKRIHHAYNVGFIAVDKSQRQNLELYVRLGEVFCLAFTRAGSYPALNALLKITDTLCAAVSELAPALRPRLARLIKNECAIVNNLAGARNVTW